jgi:putative endonuclease
MTGGDPAAAALGRAGERWAAAFLRRQGWEVIGHGFRARGGEIDLVCRRGGRLLMAEVKTRASDRWGAPEAAVNAVKQARLRRAAQDYRRLNAWRGEITHAVVAITIGDDGRPRIELFEHAF